MRKSEDELMEEAQNALKQCRGMWLDLRKERDATDDFDRREGLKVRMDAVEAFGKMIKEVWGIQ